MHLVDPQEEFERLVEQTRRITERDARMPRPGESLVKVRCGKCQRILGHLIGDERGVRSHVGRELEGSMAKLGFNGPRPHTTFMRGAQEIDVDGSQGGSLVNGFRVGSSRFRYLCHRRCGADIPVLGSKLEGAFVRALRATRTEIALPDDL